MGWKEKNHKQWHSFLIIQYQYWQKVEYLHFAVMKSKFITYLDVFIMLNVIKIGKHFILNSNFYKSLNRDVNKNKENVVKSC